MDSLERRLIELNQALLKLNSGEKIDPKIFESAKQVLAGAIPIDTGAGNDTVIINQGDCDDCPLGPSGPSGPQGSSGPSGPSGPPGECVCECKAILVSEDYDATSNDNYIGVNSSAPTTITLPCNPSDCQQIIIKAEMGPPLGNRKITIVACQEAEPIAKIDDQDSYLIEVPYQSIHLFYRGGNWWIV